LELGISLLFGAWFLVFRFRDFSGAWGLALGVSVSRGSKTEIHHHSPARLDAVLRSVTVGAMNLDRPRWFAGWFYFGPANLRVGLH
jgi:hypothetical protein